MCDWHDSVKQDSLYNQGAKGKNTPAGSTSRGVSLKSDKGESGVGWIFWHISSDTVCVHTFCKYTCRDGRFIAKSGFSGVQDNVCKFSELPQLILSNCQKPVKAGTLALTGFQQFDFVNQAVE